MGDINIHLELKKNGNPAAFSTLFGGRMMVSSFKKPLAAGLKVVTIFALMTTVAFANDWRETKKHAQPAAKLLEGLKSAGRKAHNVLYYNKADHTNTSFIRVTNEENLSKVGNLKFSHRHDPKGGAYAVGSVVILKQNGSSVVVGSDYTVALLSERLGLAKDDLLIGTPKENRTTSRVIESDIAEFNEDNVELIGTMKNKKGVDKVYCTYVNGEVVWKAGLKRGKFNANLSQNANGAYVKVKPSQERQYDLQTYFMSQFFYKGSKTAVALNPLTGIHGLRRVSKSLSPKEIEELELPEGLTWRKVKQDINLVYDGVKTADNWSKLK